MAFITHLPSESIVAEWDAAYSIYQVTTAIQKAGSVSTRLVYMTGSLQIIVVVK